MFTLSCGSGRGLLPASRFLTSSTSPSTLVNPSGEEGPVRGNGAAGHPVSHLAGAARLWRQIGHVVWDSSHMAMHQGWKTCLHTGSCRRSNPGPEPEPEVPALSEPNSERQTAHSEGGAGPERLSDEKRTSGKLERVKGSRPGPSGGSGLVGAEARPDLMCRGKEEREAAARRNSKSRKRWSVVRRR